MRSSGTRCGALTSSSCSQSPACSEMMSQLSYPQVTSVASSMRVCEPWPPPQYRAIVTASLLDRSENALISLPTSTGKTLVGEMCLVASLEGRPGVACYLAPYVALGRQVAATFSQHLPPDVTVRRFMGGVREEEPLAPTERMEVIVATPESLDALLRGSPELLDHLRCVVCDEAHMVENEGRGMRLEGLITRLRLLQTRGLSTRIVLLSAVLGRRRTPDMDRRKRGDGRSRHVAPDGAATRVLEPQRRTTQLVLW